MPSSGMPIGDGGMRHGRGTPSRCSDVPMSGPGLPTASRGWMPTRRRRRRARSRWRRQPRAVHGSHRPGRRPRTEVSTSGAGIALVGDHDDPGDVGDAEAEVAGRGCRRSASGRRWPCPRGRAAPSRPGAQSPSGCEQRPAQPAQLLEHLHGPAEDAVLVVGVGRPGGQQVVEVEGQVGAAVLRADRRPAGSRRLVEVDPVQEDRQRGRMMSERPRPVEVVGLDEDGSGPLLLYRSQNRKGERSNDQACPTAPIERNPAIRVHLVEVLPGTAGPSSIGRRLASRDLRERTSCGCVSLC